ncbi:MAG TPA: alpha/beta hydrolase [Pyrinomonadaceae bacterium]|nr:alpha/beta hydrolase [Pyrinomonadaceae bacterium]
MKRTFLFLFVSFLFILTSSCTGSKQTSADNSAAANTANVNKSAPTPQSSAPKIFAEVPENADVDAKYIFYLHGKIVEEQGENAVSPEFGAYEYRKILDALAARGFVVISEVRPKDTDAVEYAAKVEKQIRLLLKLGAKQENITIVGGSKGGVIAHRISFDLKYKNLNFVLLAACGKGYLAQEKPDLYGRVLSIYDYKDNKGAESCAEFFKASKNITESKEIELKLGSGHGIIFHPLPEWLEPTIEWVNKKR